MKYTIEQITQGEDELILRYQHLTQEVEQILNFMNSSKRKLIGLRGSTQVVIDLSQILYIESVDRKTFVYTVKDVFQVEFTLAQLEQILNTINFFRCSKSMIINIEWAIVFNPIMYKILLNALAFVAPNTPLMNGIRMSNMGIGSLVTFAGLLVLFVKYYKQHA